LTTAWTAGSAKDGSGWRTTPVPGTLRAFLIRMLSALASTTSPDLSSSFSVMSLRIRPKDEALVIRRVTPPTVSVQRYS
jgi:hypothetical protein